MAADEGIEVCERPFSVDELFSADEVLVTSTTKICLSACEINGLPVGQKDGKILKLLQEKLFFEYKNYIM